MAARNTYVRPMAGWYLRNPRFKTYLLREGTAVFLAIYLFGSLTISRIREQIAR